VSYGFSIILVDLLDKIRIGGFKLGFWFSQQGSIYVFVILIFVYVRLMNKLDKKYHVEEKEDQKK
jgi:putative solute:sodium symporter small subunit